MDIMKWITTIDKDKCHVLEALAVVVVAELRPLKNTIDLE